MNSSLPLCVVGCDFRVASTSWRDTLLLEQDERLQLAEALGRTSGVRGVVVLETCNRVEWIIDSDQPRWAAELAKAQMMTRFSSTDNPPKPYTHVGEQAAAHLFRVALGMESFVLGEREIAGQLNRAVDDARRHGLASAHIGALQTSVGRVVKRVQRLTSFGARARGVHGLAIDTLRRRLGPPSEGSWRVLIIGMGEVGRKAMNLAARNPDWEVSCANRSLTNERWLPLEDAIGRLHQFDAVVVATGARRPVLALDAVEGPLPRVVLDLGAPAQVTPSATASDEHELLGLDHLLRQETRPVDDVDLHRALELVQDAVDEFRQACLKQGVAPLFRGIWDHYDALAHERLPQALSKHLEARLSDSERGRLQVELRDELRRFTRSVLDEIRRTLDP